MASGSSRDARRWAIGAAAGGLAALCALVRRDQLRQRAARDARADAELMAHFAGRLSAATTHGDVLSAAADLAREQHGVTAVTLWSVDHEDREWWRRWYETTPGGEQLAGRHPRAGLPVDQAATEGRPILHPDPAALARAFPETAAYMESEGLRATGTFPAFDARGEPIGALGFGWAAPHRLTSAEVARLSTVARLCAETVRRIDLTTAAANDARVAAERGRRRLALAEALIATTTRAEFVAALDRAAPLLGAARIRTVTSDDGAADAARTHWFGPHGREDTEDVLRASVPLHQRRDRGGHLTVEVEWDTPQDRLDAEDTVATLVAVARPALLRTDLLAQLEERRHHSELRAAFGARLATAVTATRTAEVIADYARALLGADGAVVSRIDESDDALTVIAAGGLATEGARGRRWLTPSDGGPSYEAIRERRLVVVDDRETLCARYAGRSDLLRDTAVAAMAAFPLVAGDRPIGAVRLHYRAGSLCIDDLREHALRFAEQAAQALERAHLADRQREALERANLLGDAVAALAIASDEAQVIDAVRTHGVPALGCDAATLEPEPTSTDRRPIYSSRRRHVPQPIDGDADAIEEATARLPLTAGSETVGTLTLRWGQALAFSGAERYVLESYAEYVAQALLRARTAAREHEIVTVLQQRLLPQIVPTVDGARIAARYRPAARGLEVGGDWYDVIPLSDTRTALVVGDVVGKGPAAAASMGQLRTAVRTKAPDADPAGLVSTLDQVVEHHLEAEFMATVAYCVFDPLGRAIDYTSAGHCPALLLRADGDIEWLGATGPPVGTQWTQPRDAVRVTLDAPARIVLFTDGLVERRTESIDVGLERLCTEIRRTRDLSVDDAADAVLRTLAPPGEQSDDIALLVVDLDPAPGPLDETMPAQVESVARVRTELRDWLARSFVTGDAARDVLIATNEAVANAVEHGSADETAAVHLYVARLDGAVRVEVTDGGTTAPAHHDPDRGRGIAMMRALMDEVELAPSLVGTTVRMQRNVH